MSPPGFCQNSGGTVPTLCQLATSTPTPPGCCQNSGGTVPTLYTFQATAERCGVTGITSRPLATSTPTPPGVCQNSGGTAPTLPTFRVDADTAGILPEFRRNSTYPVYLRVDGRTMWSPWHNIQATCHVATKIYPLTVDADSAGILQEFRRIGTHSTHLPCRRRLCRDFATILADRHPHHSLTASTPTPPGFLPEFRRNGTYPVYLRVDG